MKLRMNRDGLKLLSPTVNIIVCELRFSRGWSCRDTLYTQRNIPIHNKFINKKHFAVPGGYTVIGKSWQTFNCVTLYQIALEIPDDF